MLRKLVCAVFVMAVGIGFVAADEFSAVIKKVEDGKVTFTKVEKGKGKKGEKAEEMTLPVAEKVKVNKGTFNLKEKKVEVGDKIEGGLTSETFTKIDEKKGLFARLTTSEDGKTITDIVVLQFGKKKEKTEKTEAK